MRPEKISSLKIISLSARTVVQSAEDTASHINSKLKDKTNGFKRFSLALGEAAAVNDIGQFLAFEKVTANLKGRESWAPQGILMEQAQVR